MQLVYSQRRRRRIDLTQSLANFFGCGFAFIQPQSDVRHVGGLPNFVRCRFQGEAPLGQLPRWIHHRNEGGTGKAIGRAQ